MKTNRILSLAILLAIFCIASGQAQTVVYNFGAGGATDLVKPSLSGIIAQGRDGNMYSTAPEGGYFGGGGIFEVTPAGSYSIFWNLGSIFSSRPESGLTLGTDGYFYGAAMFDESGGDYGTVFKVNAAGTEMQNIHVFDGADGQSPLAPPIEGTDGNFYGTTNSGGANGLGTVYKITPASVFTLLYSFDGPHGSTPMYPLVEGTDGNFYGTTPTGGAGNLGTVFKITNKGVITVLHSFSGPEGENPTGNLILGNDGNFYGTAAGGGANNYGSAFKITQQGKFVLLYSFSLDVGFQPIGALVLGSDGNFYGITAYGGGFYKMTPAGNVILLGPLDGNTLLPQVGPFQHTSGAFYGDTAIGGTYNDGTFYKINAGLKPFAALVTIMGKPGKSIQILGQGFTHATRVSFDGTPAKFTVASDTFLTATVPSGSKTGPVVVVIPLTGNLASKQIFRVLPTLQSFTPASGSATTPVTIDGTSLTQTKEVSFGGVVTTSFKVNSDSQIVADVPAEAKTGKIVVTTAGGTTATTTEFTITP